MVESIGKRMEADAAAAVDLIYTRLEIVLEYSRGGIRLLEEVPDWGEDGGGLLDEMGMTTFLMQDDRPLETLPPCSGVSSAKSFAGSTAGSGSWWTALLARRRPSKSGAPPSFPTRRC